VLSIATGGIADAAVILLVVAMNATIGCVTDVQAEKTIATLTKVREPRARVLREGEPTLVEASQVTIGDLLLLTPGTYVVADARLMEANHLTVAESVLTGESLPVLKTDEALAEDAVALGDRTNMVYRGTVVTGGSGVGVVVAVAADTEVGRIQALIATALRPQTPLERQLEGLGRQMVLISCTICGLVFIVGMIRGLGLLQMLRTAVSLAVAAVPEGLPTVATTTLAFGLWRLRKQNIVARHLDAIETLGSIQVICLDKTGTITLNRMVVVEAATGKQRLALHGENAVAPADAANNPDLMRLITTVALCNEAETFERHGTIHVEGSGTESALLHLALAYGIDIHQLREQHPRFRIEHRTEQQQLMATWHRTPDERSLIAAKGSPIELLRHCETFMSGGRRKQLTAKQRASIEAENQRMAGEALRVLGVAWSEGDAPDINGHLTWLGLVGIADPPREGMRELMAAFHRAGIATRIITGDQRMTAYAIGKKLGLSREGRRLEVVDATMVNGPNGEGNGDLPDAHVFARVNPSHKLEIVRAMQGRGQIVAMTGDGVNDGPALKAADVGVALGQAGAETAREVADLVLMDDDLQSLITAIREGRAIYDDIQKSVHYITATNLSEILTVLGCVGGGLGQPLTPRQLLWINVLTDVLPCLALAVEPPHSDVMQRSPRDPQAALVTGRDYVRLGRQGAVMTAAGIGGYLYALARYGAGPQASTMAFLSLTAAQLLHAFSARSEQTIVGGSKLPPNHYLPLAVGGSLALEVLAMFVPPLRALLGLAPIGIVDALICFAAGAASLIANEAFKAPRKEQGTALPAAAIPLLPQREAA
jgi:Ca2+-transporting ATPase